MRDILLKLTPKQANLDFMEIVVKIANKEDINLKDYDVIDISSVIDEFKNEFIDYIVEYGLTSFIKREVLIEMLVDKGASENKVVEFFKRYLDSIGIDEELIILDPYFYAPSKDPSGYTNLVRDILEKYLTILHRIIIITGPRIDNALKTNIETKLKSVNADLIIDSKVTDEWHDRFWISNSRKKGIIAGTSLNGYGVRYALIDKISKSDVTDIIKQLTKSVLI